MQIESRMGEISESGESPLPCGPARPVPVLTESPSLSTSLGTAARTTMAHTHAHTMHDARTTLHDSTLRLQFRTEEEGEQHD